MPALCAITAPSLVPYLRLTPHRWSAAYNNLGFRNREAGMRIAPVFETPGANVAEQYNCEYRAADASANPSCTSRSGACGAGRHQAPAPCASRYGIRSYNKDALDQGIVRLPQSLAETLDALEADDVVRNWCPPWEFEFIGKLSPEEQCARYFESY